MADDPKQTSSQQSATDDTGSVKSYDAPERTGPNVGGIGIGRIVTIAVALVLVVLLLNWLL